VQVQGQFLTKNIHSAIAVSTMLSHIVGVVTGGASGLGAATVTSLIRQGARVVVADLGSQHQRGSYLRLAQDAGGNENRLSFAETDVTCPQQVSRALDVAEEAFGEPVNAVINCAGIAAARKIVSVKKGTSTSTDQAQQVNVHSLEEFTKVLHVNVAGTFNVARLSAERMMKRKIGHDGLRGCIVNTASIAAYDGQIGQTAYAASKGAIVSLTLPMARDLAEQRIRVMTIVRNVVLDYLDLHTHDTIQESNRIPFSHKYFLCRTLF
jgi:3-hydroxyacyl-CoA dehydrogenase / 3-hydroxy-2-methylbutyryl-CoA dehydrogenase